MGSEANRDSNEVDAGSLGELSGHQCRSLPPRFLRLAHAKENHSQSAQDGMCQSKHPKEKSSLPNLPVTASPVFPGVFLAKTLQVFDIVNGCRKLMAHQLSGIRDLAQIYNFLRQQVVSILAKRKGSHTD